MNKLAAAKTQNSGVGSDVLTNLVEGLEEAAVTGEIRLKIDQNHEDLKGGYVLNSIFIFMGASDLW